MTQKNTALTQDVGDILEVIKKMSNNKWDKFENLGLILLNNPHKCLSQGLYWNDILSVFLPSLKDLEFHKDRDLFNKKPINSRSFPNRLKILKEIHKYFLTVQDFSIIQKLADNSEILIRHMNWPAMEVYTNTLSVTRRYYFMVQLLTNKDLFIEALTTLQNIFMENISKNKLQEKFTPSFVRQIFEVDFIYTAGNTFSFSKDGKNTYVNLSADC